MSPVLTQHVSQPITLDEQTQKMKRHLLQDIRRSAYVYRVDCGGWRAIVRGEKFAIGSCAI